MIDFKAPYAREHVLSFLSRFLPEDFKKIVEENIPLNFKPQFVERVNKLGETGSLQNLHIYEIVHESENDPRVGLSRDVFRLLTNFGVRKALVFFVSKKSPNYRLSLVTLDLKWESGKKVEREYSNPRRYSFFLGTAAKTHTPEEYLIEKGRIKDFADLAGRFSVEVVNKDFYEKIAILFTKLAGGERRIGKEAYKGNGVLHLPSTVDDTLKKEFAIRLIGRLVFCWFLKKKYSDAGLSLLPEELLSCQAITEHSNYYHSILEPLFFEVLNTSIDQRRKQFQLDPWAKIPFLNGGLFSPDEHDFYDPAELGISKFVNILKVPDSWVGELFRNFETYNFTIDENTSVDVELSIDPEMLGRIFENLLAEINPETGGTARKATGSYYTPRPIVEYMVDESLKQYLLTKVKVSEDILSRLLSYGDDVVDLEESRKDALIDALDSLKVIDPACGSGAFPMGILHKMLLILQKIDPDSEKWIGKKLLQIDNTTSRKELGKKLRHENWNYVHKLGIIQSSIYGVDIQPIASEISRLRFFLSLIVDERVEDDKPNRGVDSLPNLEFKFVCANSLIPLVEESGELFDNKEMAQQMQDIRERFFKTDSPRIKTKMIKDFETLLGKGISLFASERQRQLLTYHPFDVNNVCGFFDSKFMFGVDGFDIVITNPPYVGEKGHKELFRAVRQGSLGVFYKRRMDLFYFFFHVAINLLKIKGHLAFITTNYYLSSNGAKILREDFKKRTVLKKLVNFNELKIFKSALGQHNIITIAKKNENESCFADICSTLRQGVATTDMLKKIFDWTDEATIYYCLEQKQLYKGEELIIGLSIDRSSKAPALVEKIKKQGKPLSNYCEIRQGIITGADKVTKSLILKYKKNWAVGMGIFVLDEKDLTRLNLNQQERRDLIKNWITTGEIQKFFVKRRNNKQYLIYITKDDNITRYPNVQKHLEQFKVLLQNKRECKDGSMPWYSLNWPRKKEFFLQEKILTPYRSGENRFGYDNDNYFTVGNVPVLFKKEGSSLHLKFILSLLNSKLLNFWYRYEGKDAGGGYKYYLAKRNGSLSNIPIANIPRKDQESFIDLVNQIIILKKQGKDADAKNLESKIDQLVYRLYNLGSEEIEIVENLKG